MRVSSHGRRYHLINIIQIADPVLGQFHSHRGSVGFAGSLVTSTLLVGLQGRVSRV